MQSFSSTALEMALFIESDRMGRLLAAMSPASVDGQRDVVKNERRQSYDNRPYGLASQLITEDLYPSAHPYSWPVIGCMDYLTSASYEDVVSFFRRYYAPNNASITIAGEGYSYGAWSAFAYMPAAGRWSASASIQTPSTGPAIAEFMKELRGMHDPIPEEEVDRARNFLAMRYPAGFQSVAGIAARIGELIQYDLPASYFNRYVDNVLAVTRPMSSVSRANASIPGTSRSSWSASGP